MKLSLSSNDVGDKIEGVKHVIVLFIMPVLAWLDKGVICGQLIPLLLVADDHIPDCLVDPGAGWNGDINS
jgi:hypothetical protein